jgi:hypothetical protein
MHVSELCRSEDSKLQLLPEVLGKQVVPVYVLTSSWVEVLSTLQEQLPLDHIVARSKFYKYEQLVPSRLITGSPYN